MKNESIFPLERNNYFFGKLMTEREYDTEQAYFNNKRRLLNIAFASSGIVCGLTVIKTDGATIAIESGLAVDGLGRELAVPELIVVRLSELDGFADDRGHTPYAYLCAEYAETQIEPVRALGSGTGTGQFGRVRETVRMFLRYGEPEPFEIERPDHETCRTESLEDKLERGAQTLIYLARIHLVRWDDAYEIDKIELAPFGQYASVSALPESGHTAPEEPDITARITPACGHESAPPPIACGVAEVRIPGGSKPGSVYYSGYIPHGLGLVPVIITLGISSGDSAVFGDASIFCGGLPFSCAVCASNENGTFRIGVRVNKRIPAQALGFVWSAVLNPARFGADAVQTPRITLHPATARIKPLELLRITAELHGLPGDEIAWSVREPGGGDVAHDGLYIAPADPGVYTVVARCGSVYGTSVIIVQ